MDEETKQLLKELGEEILRLREKKPEEYLKMVEKLNTGIEGMLADLDK